MTDLLQWLPVAGIVLIGLGILIYIRRWKERNVDPVEARMILLSIQYEQRDAKKNRIVCSFETLGDLWIPGQVLSVDHFDRLMQANERGDITNIRFQHLWIPDKDTNQE